MPEILNWDDLPIQDWPNLLLGNGFSQHFSRNFNYASLFQEAQRQGYITQGLQTVFTSFNTVNFEEVLEKLSITESVLSALGHLTTVPSIQVDHNSVKNALISVVNGIHPQANTLTTRLTSLNGCLQHYSNVFTTNYDLILYWAVMQNPNGFKDYFWNNTTTFDIFDTEATGQNSCFIHYLHGALHLFKTSFNDTKKITSNLNNLLTAITTNISNNELPLFISEGSHTDKLLKIKQSDYLTFCITRLSEMEKGLCVFGHTLSSQYDLHLLKAIQKAYNSSRRGFFTRRNEVKLAISIYGNNQTLAQQMIMILTYISHHK